ncbi:hypothetical protein [Hydrogenophaga sp. RWCD_12]|uniref:hypothetical protein n=1 Tax=Hydrogenophaga sp. RWCD_12 TaxID=3391190 RepID=UPI00398541A3
MAGRIQPLPRLQTPAPRWAQALRLRMAGPGGLYNLGNAFGLVTGLALYLAAGQGDTDRWWDYFVGSPAALALTISMVVFYVSGEAYHQAFAGPGAPDLARLRTGDLLSGHGAVMLGVGLLFLGQPLLAATAGALHAIGKYGSVLALPVARWATICRGAVVLSRLPAMAATLLALGRVAGELPFLSVAVLTPVTMLVCYGLWLVADVMLLRPVGRP